MPIASADGIELYYETFGDPSSPPLLLVSGLGMQLVGWSEEWFQLFVDRGYFVIAYDNRDVGLSTHLVSAGTPDLLALLGGDDFAISYLLGDMAQDAVAVLDAVAVTACHVVGISMGGMVAQQLAIDHPERVISLASIMSTTGAPGVGQPTDVAASSLLVPAPRTREEAMGQAVEMWKIIGSPDFPIDEAREAALAGMAWDRSHDPTGVARQLAAILSSPDRTAALASVKVPTVVIHGDSDPLVQLSGGQATASAIPGARLVVIEGMGHHAPVELWPRIVDEIVANTRVLSSHPQQ
ncbi:MAG: alpha/beta fold hydrolase [Acidimicrobiales bacterium]